MIFNIFNLFYFIFFYSIILSNISFSFFTLNDSLKTKTNYYLMCMEVHRLLHLSILPENYHQKSRLFIKKALKMNPKELNLHLMYADFLYLNQDFEKALNHYQIFLKKEPKNIDVHYQIAMLFFHLSNIKKKWYESAVNHIQLSLQLLKTKKTLIVNFSSYYYKDGKLASFLNALAHIHAKNKNWQEAFDFQIKSIKESQNPEQKKIYEQDALNYLKFINQAQDEKK